MFDGFELFPRQASTMAGSIDAVYFFLIAITVIFSTGIAVTLVVFCMRYRWQRSRRATPIEGSLLLELLWTGIPLIISLVIFGWGTSVYLRANTPPESGMEFTATGKQWMWKLQHPTGQREINTLHVPVHQPVILTMTSEDVIHSFYVPAFRIKQDVLPGRYTRVWFEATVTGTFHLFCAEYCGTKHSQMIGQVIVMEPDQYQEWLRGQPAKSPIESGRLLFESLRCNTCHGEGATQRGPDLVGAFGKQVPLRGGSTALIDETYLRTSILEPNRDIVLGFDPLMPTYEGQLDEEQISHLIAYIKSLAEDSAAPSKDSDS